MGLWTGEFVSRPRDTADARHYKVEITTDSGSGRLVFDGKNPVVIQQKANDIQQVIIKSSCRMSVYTKNLDWMEMYIQDPMSQKVKVFMDDRLIWTGVIAPGTYSQEDNAEMDTIDIECIDYVSCFEYKKYKGTRSGDYDQNKSGSNLRSIHDVIYRCISDIYPDFSYIYVQKTGSKFDTMMSAKVNESIFFGDDFDDMMDCEEVLETILTYYDWHIMQKGNNFFIYNRLDKGLDWRQINPSGGYNTVSLGIHTITDDNISVYDRSVSIQDACTQIKVKCSTDTNDEVVTPPFDNDSLIPLARGIRLPYMTEYISEGSGDSAVDGIRTIVQGGSTGYDAARVIKWFGMPVKSADWQIYWEGQPVERFYSGYQDGQGYLWSPNRLAYLQKERAFRAFFWQFGSFEAKSTAMDDRPVNKIDMKTSLIISVNGNGYDTDATYPSESMFTEQNGLIEYTGSDSGTVLSPITDDVTNYIVFSGKLRLMPLQYETGTRYASLGNNWSSVKGGNIRKTEGKDAQVPEYDAQVPFTPSSNLVKSENNGEGRYYTRQFHNPLDFSTLNPPDAAFPGINPPVKDMAASGYQYNYTYDGSQGDSWKQGVKEDKYKKIPLLKCEMIVGNKRLIETNVSANGESTFKWVELGQEPTYVMSEGGRDVSYKITTFTLGINPIIGDNIIGKEFPLQANTDFNTGIEAEGTAIPIKKSDALSGKVQFRIIGVCNPTWEHVTRIHPTMFRHTKYTPSTHSIMAHTESVIISNFEVKVVSDNGFSNVKSDKDLVYMSDESPVYMDDNETTFDIVTQPTIAEFERMNISPDTYLNILIDGSTNLPLREISNNFGNVDLAERLYVDRYYNHFYIPRKVTELECTLNKDSFNGMFDRPNCTANGGILNVVLESEVDLGTDTVELKYIGV